ncbi:MAG: asparagine--tRNA ligase [Erysipelotrichaceae bacterium]|nr:asparagine--tRNA ligase [Erysipelotrichaceae bacterium]
MFEFVTARELYELVHQGSLIEKDQLEYVELDGWVRTNRNNGSVGFIELNDGTYFKNVQLVYSKEDDDYTLCTSLNTGDAISAYGVFKITENGKQPFEIVLKKLTLLAKCDPSYPLQKKRHSFEFLREIAHLRPKANTFLAVFRVRSVLAMAIHEFFQSQGFVYVNGPIITGNDCEGAGETFSVTTLNDFSKGYKDDFFGKHTNLTVSAQLHAEAFAQCFRDVYTFGPTFRAEKSNTTRHAAEFWMVEPEIAFADLEDDMALIEDMVKYCIQTVLQECPAEMEFFNKMIDTSLIDRLTHVLNSKFEVMTYTDAIERLKKAVENGEAFENKNITWGMDLNSEHEKYLCEKVINGPLFLINYPKEIKSFYMKLNDDNKTVAACDLLVPHIGELVGGSQREENYEKLVARMNELHMNTSSLQWYLDLRRFGGVSSAGFGLGFERMVMYVTGVSNIRDVIPFPRTVNNCEF